MQHNCPSTVRFSRQTGLELQCPDDRPPRSTPAIRRPARVRIDGRAVYLPGPYGSQESRDAYAKLIAQWVQDHQRRRSDAPRLTVNKLAVVYLQHAKTHYRKRGEPTSEVWALRAALKDLAALYGKELAADMTAAKLEAVQRRLIDRGRARTGINAQLGRIRRVYKWAARRGLVPIETYTRVCLLESLEAERTDAREAPPVTAVADAAVDAIREHVRPVVWAMIEFQRLTGARPGEALIVRGCDLTMTGDVWEYRPSRHKMEHKRRRRIIAIGATAQAALREWLRPDLQAYLFSADPDGQRPYRRDAYTNAIKRGCELAVGMPDRLRKPDKWLTDQGLIGEARQRMRRVLLDEAAAWRRENCWSPNQLRHSFATRVRRLLGSLEAVRTTLGHSTIEMSEVYAERDLEAAREVVKRIG